MKSEKIQHYHLDRYLTCREGNRRPFVPKSSLHFEQWQWGWEIKFKVTCLQPSWLAAKCAIWVSTLVPGPVAMSANSTFPLKCLFFRVLLLNIWKIQLRNKRIEKNESYLPSSTRAIVRVSSKIIGEFEGLLNSKWFRVWRRTTTSTWQITMISKD